MPRTADANSALREKTRERVLQAAVRLFSRHGFDGTSVRALAQEAGIAVGQLYAHFESKEAVLVTLMQSSLGDVSRTLDDADQEPTARGFVTVMLESAVTLVDAHRDFWRLGYGLRHQPEVLARLGLSLGHLMEQTHQRLEQALRRRGVREPRTEALLLFATVDGIAQQYVQHEGDYPIASVIRAAASRWPATPPSRKRKTGTP
ncbi:TetR/AcrR family transcriptional regulator [Corallococcus sp. BB11-1]|uniref:TetR/AcrR family transcriptional regulator n=1 Tax=Corallococcus sp. BB11-1 TaxID=2996783 RepID=UPI0010DC9A19|nr:TetR/AcrR family transcriptional regulator [Corallococcus sp. BB11-1]MCY1036501.1 TetR/AcrR family transcriptional regulator [Corallococcus sp. BB11-1]RYZ45855.1 MAG: TetR/AcrR family transcriptional regulator [Myxococcaceae bacterium]